MITSSLQSELMNIPSLTQQAKDNLEELKKEFWNKQRNILFDFSGEIPKHLHHDQYNMGFFGHDYLYSKDRLIVNFWIDEIYYENYIDIKSKIVKIFKKYFKRPLTHNKTKLIKIPLRGNFDNTITKNILAFYMSYKFSFTIKTNFPSLEFLKEELKPAHEAKLNQKKFGKYFFIHKYP